MISTTLALALGLTVAPPLPWWHTVETRPLFEGATTDGWTVLGGSGVYKWDDATTPLVLHGHGPTSRNTFLSSDKTYGDFLLDVDVKIDGNSGNSGIQLRSHWDEKKKSYYGYQIEIDSSPRQWSGGLYDEGRRAWLDSLADNPKAREAFKLGEWNRFRILAIGPRIKTWVNDVPAADYLDFVDLSGHFGFQVHSGKCAVAWRNISIADFGTRSWEPLLDAPIAFEDDVFFLEIEQPLTTATTALQLSTTLTKGLLRIALSNTEDTSAQAYAVQVPAPFSGTISIVCETAKTSVLINGVELSPGPPALGGPLKVSLSSPKGTSGTLGAINYLQPTEQERSLQGHSQDPGVPPSPH
jgi:hypothetical protein